MSDPISSPEHYTQGAIEPIDFIRSQSMGFLAGNVIKYVTRYRFKGNPIDDLRKAAQYLEWLIDEETNKAGGVHATIKVFEDDMPPQLEEAAWGVAIPEEEEVSHGYTVE